MKIKFKPFRLVVILLAIIALVAAICVFTHRNDNSEPAVKALIKDHEPLPNPIADTLCTNINGIHIFPADSVDGRPRFIVEFPNGKKINSLNAEQIAYSLLHNKWVYRKDLTIDSLTNK